MSHMNVHTAARPINQEEMGLQMKGAGKQTTVPGANPKIRWSRHKIFDDAGLLIHEAISRF